jgi:hypothetical protein
MENTAPNDAVVQAYNVKSLSCSILVLGMLATLIND